MNQTVKQKRVLIEIAQPIGGVQDYAHEAPKDRKPMARRNPNRDHGLILAASIAMAGLILILAVAG